MQGRGEANIGTPCKNACTAWADAADLCSPCDDYDVNTSLMDDAFSVASDVLFELSGRQFPGSCSDTVRPCGRTENVAHERSWHDADGGWWIGGCGCQSGRRCGCPGVHEITLGGYPVTEVTEVKVDGEVLASSRYRVDDYRYLVRLPDADGTNPGWPCCQRLDLDSDEEDTFEVTFTYGTLPPAAGVRAAAVLACELYLSCQPETINLCRLPRQVTQVTRQGIAISLLDPSQFLDKGRTGIWEVDLFLATYNPKGLKRRSQVLSPDIRRRVRRAGT